MKSEHHIDDRFEYEWWGHWEIYNANVNNGNYSKYIYKSQYFHRIDGPAIIFPDGDKIYYLFNKEISEEDFITPGFVDSYILEHS